MAKKPGGKSAEDGKGKVVSPGSLLGRALREHREFGKKLPPYGEKLDEIELQHDAGKAFETLVAIAKPASEDELASELLSLVVFAALEASVHAPVDVVTEASEAGEPEAGKREADKPEDGEPDAEERENSPVVQARLEVRAYYRRLFRALDILNGAFRMPVLENRRSGLSGELEFLSIEVPGMVVEDQPALRLALEALGDPPDPGTPMSDASGARRYIRLRTVGAPAALLALRALLEVMRDATIGSLDVFNQGRNVGEGADARSFVTMLHQRMGIRLHLQNIEFVTSMATVLFDTKGDNTFDADRVKKVLRRASRRRASDRT